MVIGLTQTISEVTSGMWVVECRYHEMAYS
jgi:hypothetical protein